MSEKFLACQDLTPMLEVAGVIAALYYWNVGARFLYRTSSSCLCIFNTAESVSPTST